jgi:hypothetical protein
MSMCSVVLPGAMAAVQGPLCPLCIPPVLRYRREGAPVWWLVREGVVLFTLAGWLPRGRKPLQQAIGSCYVGRQRQSGNGAATSTSTHALRAPPPHTAGRVGAAADGLRHGLHHGHLLHRHRVKSSQH